MSAKRAKFRVGQKVMITHLKGIIVKRWKNYKYGFYVCVAGFEIPVYWDEMRPLTRREKEGKRG